MIIVLSRIILLAALIFWSMSSPWSWSVGAVMYFIARFRWYAEAVLFGLFLDATSGLPFGFFSIGFFLAILLSEFIKPAFHEKSRYGLVVIAIAAAVLFFAVNAIFFASQNLILRSYFNLESELAVGFLKSAAAIGLMAGLDAVFNYLYYAIFKKKIFS